MTTPNPISVGFGLYERDCELVFGIIVEFCDKFAPQLPQNCF